VPGPSVTLPEVSAATAVLRQNRNLLYAAGTVMSVVPLLTMKN
jgi:hypothetical protein